ncbi:alpha/beta hydrolase [Corynebacterium lizhenjunii]|uniref:alpha/beta hydrolase n=1 Tax=Corynebacterium lizhenjunii TaxID=2709394 RepID=UPI0013ED0C87|nr:alpha/beta hydrolase [Corynebacterium lizhenjunii]
MFVLRDEYSGRPVAADAWKALEPFRAAGAKSFHHFPIEQVRANYVASAQANPLHEEVEPATADWPVGPFQVRVYDPRQGPELADATPVILFMHGGGWLMGNLETHNSLCRRLAVLTGLPVVAVDYRLAPEHPYPAAIDDCRAAYRWLSDPCAPHGLTASSIAVVGDSAGGQLAAVLANEFTAIHAADPEAVAPLSCQALLYPIVDCSRARTEGGASYQRLERGFPLAADTMRWFIDTFVTEESQREATDLSPLLHELPAGLPPSLVLTVDNDPLADEGAEYAAKLAQAGVDVTYRHLVGYHHGLFTSAAIIDRGQAEIAAVARFIAAAAADAAHDGTGTDPTA